jgi:FTR1 family protein
LKTPPPALGHSDVMRETSPAQMYRIVSVGVSNTPMAGWASVLTPDQRWDVVTYVNTLRGRALAAQGEALLRERCDGCVSAATAPARLSAAGLPPEFLSTAWAAERSDAQLALAIRDAGAGLHGQREALRDDEAAAVIAYARSFPAMLAPSQAIASAESGPDAAARRVMALLDEALVAAKAGRSSEAGDKAFDSYIAFEPLETAARAKEPGLVTSMESRFAEFKGAVKAGDFAAATQARNAVEAGLPQMVALSAPATDWWTQFLQSFLIILREGFEAILVIGAVIAFLIKTGNRQRVKAVWHGVVWALVASGVTAWIMATFFRALPASREIVEGVTMLIAVAVLFSVSYWLISKVEAAKWQSYIKSKVNAAISQGGGRALALVGFLAVYREGAETALFFQALFQAPGAATGPLAGGIAVGFVALALIFTGFYRFGVKIPMRPFFAVTSGLLYLMAFVFLGKGIRELQEGNALGITSLRGWPMIESLGIYPTMETMFAQGVILGLLAYAIWRTFGRRSSSAEVPAAGDEVPEHVHADVEGRLAELTAKATMLQARVVALEEELQRERRKRP